LDTYFRGNSQEVEFCQRVRAGGNHVVVCSASGQTLTNEDLRLRERELAPVLEQYKRLSKEQRTPALEDSAKATPPQRPVPEPPIGGLILRGYCTYLKLDAENRIVRSGEYYYKENPDRWLAETQSDLLWLTDAERTSLVPHDAHPGDRREVAVAIQKRFYGTIGIDYMEGSVNSLPVRRSTMTLTVEQVTEGSIAMRLDGYAQLGKERDDELSKKPHSRGCELRILGYVRLDRQQRMIDRFDVVGVGRAWGNKMDYVDREVRLSDYPWMYGIACELVTGKAPQDRIPPYNILHYNSTPPYFDVR
jgi:hypothetical protein